MHDTGQRLVSRTRGGTNIAIEIDIERSPTAGDPRGRRRALLLLPSRHSPRCPPRTYLPDPADEDWSFLKDSDRG